VCCASASASAAQSKTGVAAPEGAALSESRAGGRPSHWEQQCYRFASSLFPLLVNFRLPVLPLQSGRKKVEITPPGLPLCQPNLILLNFQWLEK